MTTVNEEQLIYLPFSEINKASGICQVVRNAYWITHPDKGLVFYSRANTNKNKDIKKASPQYNMNRTISEKFNESCFNNQMEVRFIDLVVIPVNVNDYAS
jgi:hypothetical protein